MRWRKTAARRRLCWSLAHIAGVPVNDYCVLCGRCADRDRVLDTVRKSAYHIIDYKGAANFAIGLALVSISRAVLRNQRSILTVSVQLNGEYTPDGGCLSVPCLISDKGLVRVVEGKLTDADQQQLKQFADVLEQTERQRFGMTAVGES
jgi:L-lactate dehydrogenase